MFQPVSTLLSNSAYCGILNHDYPHAYDPNRVHITFSNGILAEFDKEILLQMSFFKKCLGQSMQESVTNTIHLPEITFEELNLIIRLMSAKEDAREILSEESLKNPNLVEEITALLNRYCDRHHVKKTLSRILFQLETLPYDEANEIMQRYQMQMQNLSGEKEKEEQEPQLVDLAKEILVRSIYFDSPQNATCHFEAIKEYKVELKNIKDELKAIKEKNDQAQNETRRELNSRKFLILQKEYIEIRDLLKSKESQFDQQSLTKTQHTNAISHIHSPYPIVIAAAEKSKQILDQPPRIVEIHNLVKHFFHVSAAYHFTPSMHKEVGYLLELAFTKNGRKLKADTLVIDPEKPENEIKTVAVLEMIKWKGNKDNPVKIIGRISCEEFDNMQIMQEEFPSLKPNGELKVKWVVYSYDYKEKKYFKSFHTRQAVNVEIRESSQILQPMTTSFTISLFPKNDTLQRLYVSYSAEEEMGIDFVG